MKIEKKWIVWGFVFVTIGVLAVMYGCESQVRSLSGNGMKVNREELQVELETILATARIRICSLDHQDEVRNLVLQNGLILMQGQPFNPVGILTGLAAIYGVASGGVSATKYAKKNIINP